jgi:hypothetical protein
MTFSHHEKQGWRTMVLMLLTRILRKQKCSPPKDKTAIDYLLVPRLGRHARHLHK